MSDRVEIHETGVIEVRTGRPGPSTWDGITDKPSVFKPDVTDPDLASTFAPTAAPQLAVDAELVGFQACGFDPATGTVYCYSDDSSFTLYSTSDPSLRDMRPVYQWASGTIRNAWVTSAGTVLVMVSRTGNALHDLWRKPSGGTFSKVIDGYGASGHSALQNNMCQTADGTLYYGEYNTSPGTQTHLFRKSTDDGATWTTVETFASVGAHQHAVMADPYVTNRIWRCWGDDDTKCKVEYSDNGGTSWTVIGSGDQTWRSVSLIFTADEVIMGGDTPYIDPPIMAWNRTTGQRRTILADAETELFYGVKDSTGLFAWTANSALVGADHAVVWVGDTAVGAAAPRQAFRTAKRPESSRVNQYLYGPTANNGMWLTVAELGPTRWTSKLFHVRLVRSQQPEARNVVLPDFQNIAKPQYLLVGPDPAVLTTKLALTAGREYMMGFVAPEYPMAPVGAITLMNGTTLAGNISVGIRDATGINAIPGVMLGQSPATAHAGANVEQKFTLDKKVNLIPGRMYWLSLVGDTAGAEVVGTGQTSFKSGWWMKIQASGQTVPAAVAAPTITSAGFRFSSLLTSA